ncbi:DNA repair ATPase RecN [Algoriphagus iocasae]|uniref:DNA repair ATPase RecN n=1 Tax=Algoriphagus iocasae TaxID=1836499 RepID=A0A841MJR0_9BACT|nr:TerB family tellurite resistance protein [Algoriphagus iocasae]MBB6324486.1 DNA repair ATPase RecN [Algoriphagus iocasae]
MESGNLKTLLFALLLSLGLCLPGSSSAQQYEATQLMLNYEKLVQLKKILDNMYQGYTILSNGYNRVKNIAEGNFRLHEAFLDGLLQVSPEVRSYYRVAEIIRYQQYIINEYRATYNQVRASGDFSGEELDVLEERYSGFFKASLRNLDELAMILTAGELRMSDFERLEAIDRLHDEISGLLISLRSLNTEIGTLQRQRQRLKDEKRAVLKLTEKKP